MSRCRMLHSTFCGQAHRYHHTPSRFNINIILAAADFPEVCRLQLEAKRVSERRTSYSVISLPKIGYSVDELRELIWLPLKALRDGRLGSNGERTHLNLRPIDRTGVFEKTAAMLDWDRELDNGDKTNRKDESDDGDSDDHDSITDSDGEKNSDEDNDEDGNDEGDSDEDNDEDGNDEGDSDEDSDEESDVDSDEDSDEDGNDEGTS